MSAYSIIKLSQLEGAKRIDAEFYQPEYLAMEKKFKKINWDFLKNLAYRISRGKQPIYVDNGNVLVLTSDQIRNDFLDLDSAKHTDENYYRRNKKAQLKFLDVLLNSTGIGTLGRVNFYYLDEKAVADSHITIIRTFSKKLDPIFLNIFLKTAYGEYQINRSYTGSSGQIELYPEHIKRFKIFLPSLDFQREIAKLVKRAIKLHQTERNLYFQAERFLLQELGLKDFKPQYHLSYTTTFSNTFNTHRIDAEYFQPIYEKMIEQLQKFRFTKLGEIATVERGSLIPPEFYHFTKGIPYIRGKNFSSNKLTTDNLIFINESFQRKNETIVKKGDIVFALIGTVGSCALVFNEFDGAFISNNVGKISLKKGGVMPEYLNVVLSSLIGKLQFERYSTQTAQPKILPSDVRKFLIPLLSKPIQQKISSLVQQSHQTRQKAKQLLEEAKRKVEKEIEKELWKK